MRSVLAGLAAALLLVVVLASTAAAPAAPEPHPASCDGKSVDFHVHRARAILLKGYDESRFLDRSPLRRSEKQGVREHKFCVPEGARERVATFRDAVADDYQRKLFNAAPWLSPRGKRLVSSLAGTLATIRRCESGSDYTTDTGNTFYGAYQFTWSTWQTVGGHGNPAHASPAEQDYRAALLYSRSGSSPWPVCGV